VNAKMRLTSPEFYAGREIFEITPIILGGSPTDPANKTVLTRENHIKAVVYWNRMLRDLRSQKSGHQPHGERR